jgi:hypothetical protein
MEWCTAVWTAIFVILINAGEQKLCAFYVLAGWSFYQCICHPTDSSCCLFSFFSNRESSAERPKLLLGPGNATVSSNLSVTLGCRANVAIRTCTWIFYPAGAPGKVLSFCPKSARGMIRLFSLKSKNAS